MKSLLFCLIVVPCLALPRQIQIDDGPAKLPDGAISCQIDSPSRDECIKEAIQDMLPKLMKGMDDLNIPPLDPFTYNGTTMEYRRGEIYALLTVKTLTFHGLSTAEIKDVRTKIDDYGMQTEIDYFVPRMYAEGLYKASGRLGNFKINAKGAFNVTFSDTSATTKKKGIFQIIDGEKYLLLDHFDIIPSVGDLKVQMTGISADPEVNKLAVEVINQYWPLLYRGLVSETKRYWEPAILDVLNAFLLRLPYSEMLFYGDEKSDA